MSTKKATKKAAPKKAATPTPAKSAVKHVFDNHTLQVVEHDGKRYVTETCKDMSHFLIEEVNVPNVEIQATKTNVIAYDPNKTLSSAGNPITGESDVYFLVIE